MRTCDGDHDENAAINLDSKAARSADSVNGRRDEVRPGFAAVAEGDANR